MARYLAAEWEPRQARFVVVNARGGRLRIEACRTVTTEAPEGGLRGPHPELGARLSEALREAGVNRTLRRGCLVGVSRAQVDLRQLTLPPASDAELPELARLQAVRELSVSNESFLDFIPLTDDASEPRSVLATALSAESQEQNRAVCTVAELEPERLVLRTFAAASLLARRHELGQRVTLLVDVLCDEADMTVICDGRVVVSRCLRLPSEEEDPVPLLAEIRRTILAVANQSPGGPVEIVYLCGSAAENEDLCDRLRDALQLPVEIFDPLTGIDVGQAFAQETRRGPYAALLGMIADEADRKPPAIDFLHPRKAPPPRSRKRMAAIAGAAVAAGVIALVANVWGQFAELNAHAAALAKQSKELDKAVKRAGETEASVAAIEAWTAGDITWLDELQELSVRFPKGRDAVLSRLTMSRAPAGGGTMEMEGLVRHPQIIERMETNLRDEYHEVRSKRVQESVQGKNYTWQFESSLSVAKRDREQYVGTAATEPGGEPHPVTARAPGGTE